jgi:hypothetical protein
MELLPAVGWAEVATKHDLAVLRTELDARFDRIEGRFDARFEAMDVRFDSLGDRLDGLKYEMRATVERELRGQTWKFFAIYAASMGTLIGALIAGTKL